MLSFTLFIVFLNSLYPNSYCQFKYDTNPCERGVTFKNFVIDQLLYQEIQNCSTLKYLDFALIEHDTLAKLSQVRFPNLVEVREYVSFSRVFNLVTLANMFPKLATIKGEKLINSAALIIEDVRDFETLDLPNQLVTINGGVRLFNKHDLCLTNKDMEILVKAIKSPPQLPIEETAQQLLSNLVVEHITTSDIGVSWDNTVDLSTHYRLTLIPYDTVQNKIKEYTDKHHCFSHFESERFIHLFKRRHCLQFSSLTFSRIDTYVSDNDLLTNLQNMHYVSSVVAPYDEKVDAKRSQYEKTQFDSQIYFIDQDNIIINNHTAINGRTTHIFHNVLPNQNYYVLVDKCSTNRCLLAGYITYKTNFIHSNQNIPNKSVNLKIITNQNPFVLINWDRPPRPNYPIMGYELLVKKDTEKFRSYCIRNNNKSIGQNYTLDIDYDTTYTLRLRTISAKYRSILTPYNNFHIVCPDCICNNNDD